MFSTKRFGVRLPKVEPAFRHSLSPDPRPTMTHVPEGRVELIGVETLAARVCR